MQGRTVEVPDVVGFDVTDACDMVRVAELVPCGPELGPVPTAGTVVAQDPAAGTGTEPDKPVALWTQGPRTADELVPDSGAGAAQPAPA